MEILGVLFIATSIVASLSIVAILLAVLVYLIARIKHAKLPSWVMIIIYVIMAVAVYWVVVYLLSKLILSAGR